MVPLSEQEVTQEDVKAHTAKSVRVRCNGSCMYPAYAIDYQEQDSRIRRTFVGFHPKSDAL